MGLLDWFGDKRKPAVPDALWARTVAALPFLSALAVDEQKELKTLVEGFLAGLHRSPFRGKHAAWAYPSWRP